MSGKEIVLVSLKPHPRRYIEGVPAVAMTVTEKEAKPLVESGAFSVVETATIEMEPAKPAKVSAPSGPAKSKPQE